ncbi:MAG: glycerophosphodiester phosphodiesterase [Ilumatobacteraceae bacterium]
MPWLFAHRGARAHERENTMDSFRLAQRLGATGIESDVWLTRDGVAVLDHDGLVGGRLRRRAMADVDSEELPAHVPQLPELLDFVESHRLALALDIKDPAVFAVVRDLVLMRGPDLVARTYLCFDDFATLREVVADAMGVQLVDSSRLARIKEGPERRIATLASLGVTALNMHHTDWNGGLVTLAHRFERLAFAWDAQFEPVLTSLLRMGADAVFSDWVDRMVDAARATTT